MFDNHEGTAIAKISKIYGPNGELIIRLYDNFPATPNYNEPFFIKTGGIIVPLFLSSFAKQGNSKAVVVFNDFDTEYRIKELIGLELLTLEDEEGEDEDGLEDGEVLLENLVGYTLRDIVTGKSGIITSFIDNAKNPLFEVDIQGTDVYIPANEDLIELISIEDEAVDMKLPQGLLDLYNSPDSYQE